MSNWQGSEGLAPRGASALTTASTSDQRSFDRQDSLDLAKPDDAPQGAETGGKLGKVLTSDQFVAGIIAMLALKGRRHFLLTETELDRRFQAAFEDLATSTEINARPNFTFFVDPFHGDSVALRETLLAAKEKELIALNNPTFRTFDVKLTEQRAERYLMRVPLPRSFLEGLIERHFPAS